MVLRAPPNKQQADKDGSRVSDQRDPRSRGAGGAAHADGRGGRQG